MALFSFKRKVVDPADSGVVERGKRTIKRSPPVAMEVKLLALEGLEAGESNLQLALWRKGLDSIGQNL